MLKLYQLRKICKDHSIQIKTKEFGIDNDWNYWNKTINKLIAEDKNQLSQLLDQRLNDHTPRTLNEVSIRDKNIVALFDSSLTRTLNLKINELTEDLFILNVYFFQVFSRA